MGIWLDTETPRSLKTLIVDARNITSFNCFNDSTQFSKMNRSEEVNVKACNFSELN